MLNMNIKAAATRAVFMVISREQRNSVTRLPPFDAGYEHGRYTNEFAAHE
jgi:hypothetical protein